MKLLVLGAAGRTGREVVRQAVEQGHEVVAFVRKTESLQPKSHLTIVTGDAEDAVAVTRAAEGCEAVVSALGHTSASRSNAQTEATKALLGMLPPEAHFVSLTGFNVADPNDPQIPLLGRLMGRVIQLLPGGVYDDAAEHARLLRASKVNWTLLRAPRLTMSSARGYDLGYFALSATDSVARADVAAAMLTCLTDPTWSHQAPMIRTR